MIIPIFQTSMDQLQMHSASAIHNTAWNVVYGHVALCQTNNDTEESDLSKKLYHDLCCQLPRTSLMPCLMDLCRSLGGIMRSYRQIYHFHEMQENDETKDYVLKKLSNGFQRIWQDVQTKVKTLLTAAPIIRGISIDEFIKIVDTIHILIEVGRKFCGSDSDGLQESIKSQCLTYFRAFHKERLDELQMHLENEGWALCPVKSTFKVLQLKEFKSFSVKTTSSTLASTPIVRSPRKSALQHTNAVNDLVAPFDNYLDESILEEDFMIEGDEALAFYNGNSDDDEENDELNRDFIDEGDIGKTKMTNRPKLNNPQVPILTNTSLMLLRLIGKYLHLMQMLEPISNDIFHAMNQLLEFYVLTVYRHFTKNLVEPYNSVMKPRFTAVMNRIQKSLKVDVTDNMPSNR